MTPRTARALGRSILAALGFAALWVLARAALRLAEKAPQIAANRLILNLITFAIVVLAIGFAGIVIRNLVRITIQRKRGILGARLRTKLVFFFLALVLLPSLILSYGTAAFLKQSVDNLLKTPVETVTDGARELIKETGRQQEERTVRAAQMLAEELHETAAVGAADAARVAPVLERRRRLEGLQLVLAWQDGRDPVWAEDPEIARDPALLRSVRDLARSNAEQSSRSREPVFRVEPVAERPWIEAAAPWSGGAVVVASFASRNFATRIEQIAAGEDAYRSFKAEQRGSLRFYYSLITLVGLATVFVASWIGMYLAGQIARPMASLAAAAREISAGNLDVRVHEEAGDEVGVLVDAFNEMAGQLHESREVITRNTADLRRTNLALEERRRYVETLVANLSTAVLSLDRAGRVTTANPAVEAILGLRLEPGEDVRSRLDASGLVPLVEAIEEVSRSGGQTVRRELSMSRSGERLVVSAQIAPLRGGHGEDLGTLVMVEDLTDLIRAQKAAAWREVARRIAHEIKNPLTPIQLAAQRLRKRFSEGAPDVGAVVAASTASIEQEVAALKRLVDEFSLYARLPEPAPEPTDMRKVVDSVVTLYRGAHPAVGWEIAVRDDLRPVRVDPEQMRRVLINLVDNAVSAMNGAGTIRISCSAPAGPGSLRVEVEDTGPGIPAAHRSRLFDPYFSTKGRGTGLGLAIVHRVVTDHRGTIRVDGAPEGGARFVIDIPADSAEGAGSAAAGAAV